MTGGRQEGLFWAEFCRIFAHSCILAHVAEELLNTNA